MTTQAKTNGKVDNPFDVQAVVERWTEVTRKTANDSLDLYLKTVDQLADVEVKAAEAVKLPAFVTLAETHAKVSREVADSYATTVRDLLKA
jgi:hypothetical protein